MARSSKCWLRKHKHVHVQREMTVCAVHAGHTEANKQVKVSRGPCAWHRSGTKDMQ